VNLLRNHVGLWLIQESKRHWEKEGLEVTFGELSTQARSVQIDAFIDIKDPRFFEPGNMPDKIKSYCQETQQTIPETVGEIVKVIVQSLAKEIALTLQHIEEAVGKSYKEVHLFGGGIQDALFCELIGIYSKKKVVIGPKEATGFGNVIDQLIALEAMSENDRIQVLKNSI
jgi:sugar (pentulose or hexulose) kinase